ncbi:Di-and tricarboxylate transporters [butyrate-producing bacterium SM4/1]|nr:Di-and tricarboxylate transporters [butyrate-producing bacterium SM4/1]
MTTQMIIALAITAFMVVLIMMDKLPFGAPPLLACLLLVIFGIADIKAAFGGFSNATIVMLAEFMAIIAALQKTSFIAAFKRTMFNIANKGGLKAYLLMILIVMLGCSLFGTGSTAYYVMVIGLLSTLPYSKKLPPSKVVMTAGFAANHPLIPFNTALQYGIVIAVLNSAGVMAQVSVAKFAVVNFFLSVGFLLNCVIQYKFLPDHPISAASEDAAKVQEAASVSLPKWKENVTYIVFVVAVIGMLLQSTIGDAGYAIAGLSVAVILVTGVMDFKEIRDAISAPIILMSAGVIDVADALGSTGLTDLVGSTVANMLGTNVNPFVMIFVFCILTSVLATLTGSTIGTVYVFAPLAIATCTSLGLDPTAAACAIVISGWCGHFLPIDGMPAMVMGVGNYSSKEFCKFTIPQYFIRLLFLTAGALIVFPMLLQEC